MAAGGSFRRMLQVFVVLLLCLASASDTIRSYYDTLDVEPTASDSQIKKSFRSLAVRYHPDKNKSANAETTFREIAEAYAVLSNKKKRKLYDSVGHAAFIENKDSFEPEDELDDSFHFSFAELFQDFGKSPIFNEAPFEWSVLQEEEDALYEHYSFDGTDFSFFLQDEEPYI